MMIVKENRSVSGCYKNICLEFIVIFIIIISSCVTQRDIEYMHDRNKDIKSFNEAELSDYRIKPSDELYIQISSLDEAAASVFSITKEQSYNTTATIQPYGASLLSYGVDKEGYLLLPVIGNIFVKDKTLSQVCVLLKDSLSHILNQPIVSVKLVNRYVSVLGEVAKPGLFPYAQEKLTIYDALALAGDITVYGNRTDVILVRNEDGKNIRVNVNLNKSDLLSSSYYNLRPNDIIYVKSLRKRFWGMSQFPYAMILSTITTALLMYNVLK